MLNTCNPLHISDILYYCPEEAKGVCSDCQNTFRNRGYSLNLISDMAKMQLLDLQVASAQAKKLNQQIQLSLSQSPNSLNEAQKMITNAFEQYLFAFISARDKTIADLSKYNTMPSHTILNDLTEASGNIEKTLSDADEYSQIISTYLAQNQHYKALLKMQEISVKQWNDEMQKIGKKLLEGNAPNQNNNPFIMGKPDLSYESILSHVGLLPNTSLNSLGTHNLNSARNVFTNPTAATPSFQSNYVIPQDPRNIVNDNSPRGIIRNSAIPSTNPTSRIINNSVADPNNKFIIPNSTASKIISNIPSQPSQNQFSPKAKILQSLPLPTHSPSFDPLFAFPHKGSKYLDGNDQIFHVLPIFIQEKIILVDITSRKVLTSINSLFNEFPIGGYSLVSLENGFLISGGNSNNNQAISNSYIFDTLNKRMNRTSNLNVNRAYHSMINLENIYVYVIGGENQSGSMNLCEKYNIQKDIYENLSSRMNIGRSKGNLICIGKRFLYYLGGINGAASSNGLINNIEKLDLNMESKGWSIINNQSNDFLYRFFTNALELPDGNWLIFGGESNNQSIKDAYIFHRNEQLIPHQSQLQSPSSFGPNKTVLMLERKGYTLSNDNILHCFDFTTQMWGIIDYNTWRI